MVFIAVGAAIQPLVSFHYGAKIYPRLSSFLKLAILTAFIIGVILVLIGIFGKSLLLDLFGISNPTVVAYTEVGIHYYFFGYLFLGFNLVIAEYFQAIKRIRFSTLIVLSRSIFIFMPLLYLLPLQGNDTYIWLAFPLAEGVTCLGLILLMIFNTRLRPIPN